MEKRACWWRATAQRRVVTLALGLAALGGAGGCGGGPTGPGTRATPQATPAPTPAATPAATPTPGTTLALSGSVVGSVTGQPIAGSRVSVLGRTATTGADGRFNLTVTGGGVQAFEVSGDGHHPRRTNRELAGAVGTIDVLEIGRGFNLGFYREIARDAESGGALRPLWRWDHGEAVFYLDTRPERGSGAVVSIARIDAVARVLRAVMPVFTRGLIDGSRVVVTSSPPPDHTRNSVIIRFSSEIDGLGVTRTQALDGRILSAVVELRLDPDFPFDELAAHELGHAVGFTHASSAPSVMVAIGVFGGLYSAPDALHMRIAYTRVPGNTDIDNDPPNALRKRSGEPMVGRFTCK